MSIQLRDGNQDLGPDRSDNHPAPAAIAFPPSDNTQSPNSEGGLEQNKMGIQKRPPQPPDAQLRLRQDSDPHFTSTGLQILGIGVQYPDLRSPPEALERIAKKHYPSSTSLNKVLAVNRSTGIDFRSTIVDEESELVNGKGAPSIAQLSDVFLTRAVDLSVLACRKALAEARTPAANITHMISTTCTHSANPGFDQYVANKLGLRKDIAKVLLHGVGCSGGLAALRTASKLALGEAYQGRAAKILILACELTSPLVRSELDSIHQEQQTRIGACLFSDCASSMVLDNGLEDDADAEVKSPLFELMGSRTEVIPDTIADLGFDVDPLGWKVILSQRIPTLVANALPDMWQGLMNSVKKEGRTRAGKGTQTDGHDLSPPTPPHEHQTAAPTAPGDFDWALHPGGLTIITGVETAMRLKPEDLRASYEIYVGHGNSSSATVIAVLDRLRKAGSGREYVTACAVGPGISVELMLLKRLKGVIHDGAIEEERHSNEKTSQTRLSADDRREGPCLLNGEQEKAIGDGKYIQPHKRQSRPALTGDSSNEPAQLINGKLKHDEHAEKPRKRKQCSADIEEDASKVKAHKLQKL